MKQTKIEWCDLTWNPVTGCLHGCPYCYARNIAKRFGMKGEDGIFHFLGLPEYKNIYVPESELQICPYPFGFDPTFHSYRLGEPAKRKKPAKIFVCSMADLFGEWVPEEWIRKVFEACKAAPQHQYLFLTKNPQRYNELIGTGDLPLLKNFWYGGTRTGVDGDREHEAAMCGQTFLSIEPIHAAMEEATINAIEFWDWVILGAETGNRKNKITPKPEWVADIVNACKAAGVPVFMKESLVSVVGESNMLRQWPKGMEG